MTFITNLIQVSHSIQKLLRKDQLTRVISRKLTHK